MAPEKRTENRHNSHREDHARPTATSSASAPAVDQLRDKAEDMRDKAVGMHDDLHAMGSIARDAAQEKVADWRATAQDQAQQWRETAEHSVEELRDAAGEFYTRGRERAMEFEEGIEDRIRANPLSSIMIAAGVGMLAGILWMRRD